MKLDSRKADAITKKMDLAAKEKGMVPIPLGKFRFTCDRCGKCCENGTVITLKPFDILSISKATNKTTTELFENDYFHGYRGKDSGFPGCTLNTTPVCVFKKNNQCGIYEFRPLQCRLFPIGEILAPFDIDNINSYEQRFYVHKNCSSIPIERQKNYTVNEWIKQQNVEPSLNYAREWKQILLQIGQLTKYPIPESITTIIGIISYHFDGCSNIRTVENIHKKYRVMLQFLHQLFELLKQEGIWEKVK